MDYTIAVGSMKKSDTVFNGLTKAFNQLEDAVTELLDEGYTPVCSLTIHEFKLRGVEMVEIYQPMLKK